MMDLDELESWLRSVKIEYVAGDLTIAELESEVWRYLTAYEEARNERLAEARDGAW